MAQNYWVPLAIVFLPGRGNYLEPALPADFWTLLGDRLASSFDDSLEEGWVLVIWKDKELVLKEEEDRQLRENGAFPEREGVPEIGSGFEPRVATKFRRRFKHTLLDDDEIREETDISVTDVPSGEV